MPHHAPPRSKVSHTLTRLAVCLIATLLLCSAATTPVQAGTPPGFECQDYLDLAVGIVTDEEWETLSTISQWECEALFYRFDKFPRSYVVDYLESGYFINDLAEFEVIACAHNRESHCKDCDPSLTCDEISDIVVQRTYRWTFRHHWRNAETFREHVTVIVTWLGAVISR